MPENTPSSPDALKAQSTPPPETQPPAGAPPDAQTKTQPRPTPPQAHTDGNDTRTQLIRPPDDVVHMESGDRKLLKISCHKCLQKLDVTFLDPFSRFNCPSCGVELIVPKWFDNYLLEEPGGIGGMATVYRGLDLALDREVAIKVLNPDVAGGDQRAELFLHEARTAATINHYAVIPIYTCGVFENQPYIVMQYMGGGSLEVKLKQAMGTLPVNDVAKWIRDVAEGLDNARRHGIIHHDVKPGNIMLDSDGNAKIGDFGLAQAVNDARNPEIAELTKTWLSPHYVSPEKVRDGKEDFTGDIYSLGACFYHLATGFTPFNSPNIDELMKMRLTSDPVPPHQQRPDLPLPLSRLILAMMDRTPANRPHYRDIAKTLTEFLKGADTKVKPQAPAPKGPKLKVSAAVIEAKQNDYLPSRNRGGNGVAILVFLLLLGLVAGGGYYGWKTGFLKEMLGGAATQAVKSDEFDKAPEIKRLFATGDASAAGKAAEKLFSNVNASTEARMQAAVQLALANYLLKDPKAKENCSFIVERIEAIKTAANPSGEMSFGDNPEKMIAGFLSNYEVTPVKLRESLTGAPEQFRLAALLAITLRDFKLNAAKEALLKDLSEFLEEANEAPKELWSNAWQTRADLWRKTLEGAALPPNEKLEPFLAEAVKKNVVKPAKPAAVAKKPEGKPAPVAPTVAAQQAPSDKKDEFSTKFSALAISNAMAAQDKARPRPDGLQFEQSALDTYLSTVPQPKHEIEEARCKQLFASQNALNGLLVRIPFETESFESRTGDLGKGTLLAVANGEMVFKTEAGRRTVLKWEEITGKQCLRMFEYYSNLMEKLAAGPEASRDVLKAAVAAAWFGDFKMAAQCAQTALRLNPALSQEAEGLLLK